MGSQREQNQDRFAIVDLGSGQTSRPCICTDVSVSRPGVLLLVCDGMGGAPAGDVAAQMAAVSIKDELRAAGSAVSEEPGQSLKRAVEGANRAILSEASSHPEERGMGTTCTAAVVSSDVLSIAQVGDSRAYLLRDGQLRLLTRDQTMAAQLLDAGLLKPDQVDHFPYRHVLSQALGTDGRVKPVLSDHELRDGDRVLLCSDGLHGPVSDDVIAAILRVTPDVADATKALIAAALAAGGPDNVTVLIADCGSLHRPAA
jgi:serine/threonine protein phosphatase PrpC